MTAWVPGRGFVQTATAKVQALPGQARALPGQASAKFYAGPGGRNAPQAAQSAPNTQTGQSAQPGQAPQHSHGPHHPSTSSGGYIATEEQQGRIGKPWKPYAELTGMSMDFDRLQYQFNNIEAMTGGNSRTYTAKRKEDQQWQEGIDRGEVDMTAPDQVSLPAGPRRLAITRRSGHDLTNVRTGQMAGEEIGSSRPGIGGSQGAIEATSRDATPLVQPAAAVGTGPLALNAAPAAPARNTSVGKARAQPRQSGLGIKGMGQANANLDSPVQGKTAASMI